jgi:chromate transporter
LAASREIYATGGMSMYWRLVQVFGVLSILGFGGGKGIIPQMQLDVVGHYHWVTSAQFSEFYTIGKLVPGPTTIFSALIGFAAAGITGAAVALAAMFLPSSALMVLADSIWMRWKNADWKGVISKGLAPVIVGLVWSSVFAIGKGVASGAAAYAIAAIVAVLMLRTKLSAPLLIVLSGVAGVAVLR